MYCNIRLKMVKTFERYFVATYVWYMCNIQIGTLATYVWNKRNILNTTSENTRNIPLKHLQYVQHPRSTFTTSMWNNCNIPLKHLFAACASIATSPCWGRASRRPWRRQRPQPSGGERWQQRHLGSTPARVEARHGTQHRGHVARSELEQGHSAQRAAKWGAVGDGARRGDEGGAAWDESASRYEVHLDTQ
jgi:hypothetical protein